ncbi:Gfo/Idh/MocA family oxidoreductase [Cellulomonas chengniuliangii]|uniref:Gfo/Idh/MocA family oxidoreductase n=1 Tax=Cellulomonas chengniuliangii TaxID=2968084 RepID=A0ABY5L4N6_9CELL|nr:Gfo/Idh/MocA family oxidoreductase [Cellulomonas chengniuliangii]MCC2308143.1 Gfo/Idh/MocA family oxidoreductase [Cellulomonas chengniuliangii]MCC2317151.1 Gfo/Idh/MocA family oxidoreductase [Cellulomonas chengniuliangii]UUI76537.1 Gfo/Idh/MocA family oxidoreductase [Cellulomonas chengniuliangii]
MSVTRRVGLVGYGSAGRSIHSRLLREAGLRVTHVVTRSPERSAAAREDWPGVTIVRSVGALLERAAILDLVVIASPTAEHAAQAHAVLEAGLPVVVDKPLATTTETARALARAAEGAGARLTVFQNRRWDPEQLTLQSVIASGELGVVHRFERRWERWRPEPQRRWKEQDLVGGGLLLDLGAHLVDSAIELFGAVVSVYAELRSITTPAEDDVFLALTHRSTDGGPGVISHLQASGITGAPGPRTRVLGDKGAYLVTSYEGEATPFSVLDETWVARGRDKDHEGWLVHGSDRVAVPRAPGGHQDFYRDVVRWLDEGAPPPVDPWDAVRTATVLDAARVSARESRVVTLGPATTG